MPIGMTGDLEHLVLVRKSATGAVSRTLLRPARFVPLTGAGARAVSPAVGR
jgi:protein-L-isoaspartate(D-aspartate) O-methyltransferase